MIQLHSISLALGGHPILEKLSWTIGPGRRIGLIGANGAGKTTLLRVIAGQLTPDEGTVSRSGTIGYLTQDVQEMDGDRTVMDETLTAFEHIDRLIRRENSITRALARDNGRTDRLLADLEQIHAQLAVHEAHSVQSRCESVLIGLGFEGDDFGRALRELSGGYRMRVALARLLLQAPDVLLLDEPTNHLDITTIDWLEQYLKGYRGTMIIVSHDRYFLNRMTGAIAHLRHGSLTEYAGNYDFFLIERTKRRQLELAAYENQQRDIARTRRFIERFRYKASKARQVQSRVKYLSRLELLRAPEPLEPEIRIRFPAPRRSGRMVLSLSAFTKVYTTDQQRVTVFHNAGPLAIERGSKIALIGKNGAGKSTLARILLGTEPFDGVRTPGYHVDTGFFAQHQAETLSPDHTVLESLREVSANSHEVHLRTLLGAFLFTGDDVLKPVRVLSGGEKSRLALARTFSNPANFLILDEPTNHLDIQSIQILIEALRQFAGTLVIVSHDRHFLDQVADTVWHADQGTVRVYQGTYSEYRWACEHGSISQQALGGIRGASRPESRPPVRSGGPKSKEQKRREAEARNRAFQAARSGDRMHSAALTPVQRTRLCQQAETAIEDAENRRMLAEAELTQPEVYSNPDRARKASKAFAAIEKELSELYEQWESLAESL